MYHIVIRVERPGISVTGLVNHEPLDISADEIRELFTEIQDTIRDGSIQNLVVVDPSTPYLTRVETLISNDFLTASDTLVHMWIKEAAA